MKLITVSLLIFVFYLSAFATSVDESEDYFVGLWVKSIADKSSEQCPDKLLIDKTIINNESRYALFGGAEIIGFPAYVFDAGDGDSLKVPLNEKGTLNAFHKVKMYQIEHKTMFVNYPYPTYSVLTRLTLDIDKRNLSKMELSFTEKETETDLECSFERSNQGSEYQVN